MLYCLWLPDKSYKQPIEQAGDLIKTARSIDVLQIPEESTTHSNIRALHLQPELHSGQV